MITIEMLEKLEELLPRYAELTEALSTLFADKSELVKELKKALKSDNVDELKAALKKAVAYIEASYGYPAPDKKSGYPAPAAGDAEDGSTSQEEGETENSMNTESDATASENQSDNNIQEIIEDLKRQIEELRSEKEKLEEELIFEKRWQELPKEVKENSDPVKIKSIILKFNEEEFSEYLKSISAGTAKFSVPETNGSNKEDLASKLVETFRKAKTGGES